MTRPMLRDATNANFIDVFCNGGWKVKLPDGSYITMTAQNTKFRNSSNTGWVDLWCPVPPPTSVTGGNLRANRLVDSNGYLWCAGYCVGVYENGLNRSDTWSKVKYSAGGEYIKDIERMESGGARQYNTPPTTLFLRDGRVLFAGDPSYGNRGNGTGTNAENLNSTVYDVTAAWNASLGSVASISHFDIRGCIIRDDGAPYVLGLVEYNINDGSPDAFRGYLGAASDTYHNAANNHVLKYAWRWKRPSYTPDGYTIQPLPPVASMVKSTDEFVFAITADGRLLQPSYYERLSAPSNPTPYYTTAAMRELYTSFTGGTPLRLHAGGFLETTSGDLFSYERKAVAPYDKYFQEFLWVPMNINVNSLGSPVKRISGTVKQNGYSWRPTLFILLEDGRLLATGDNTDGWFGTPSVTITALGELILIHSNVIEFDIHYRGCIVMLEGGSMFAAGWNGGNYLGLGVGAPTNVPTWMPCVFA